MEAGAPLVSTSRDEKEPAIALRVSTVACVLSFCCRVRFRPCFRVWVPAVFFPPYTRAHSLHFHAVAAPACTCLHLPPSACTCLRLALQFLFLLSVYRSFPSLPRALLSCILVLCTLPPPFSLRLCFFLLTSCWFAAPFSFLAVSLRHPTVISATTPSPSTVTITTDTTRLQIRSCGRCPADQWPPPLTAVRLVWFSSVLCPPCLAWHVTSVFLCSERAVLATAISASPAVTLCRFQCPVLLFLVAGSCLVSVCCFCF